MIIILLHVIQAECAHWAPYTIQINVVIHFVFLSVCLFGWTWRFEKWKFWWTFVVVLVSHRIERKREEKKNNKKWKWQMYRVFFFFFLLCNSDFLPGPLSGVNENDCFKWKIGNCLDICGNKSNIIGNLPLNSKHPLFQFLLGLHRTIVIIFFSLGKMRSAIARITLKIIELVSDLTLESEGLRIEFQ